MSVAAMALAGCAAQPPVVYVPKVCSEPEPERPSMPTEDLQPGVDLDTFTQAAIAEIERREGYEVRLRTAFSNCKRE